MTRQIFTSDEYQNVWGQDPDILYQMPLLWLETLDKENYEYYMQQLQNRHDKDYQRREDNVALYQVRRPDGEKRFIRCQVIKCKSSLGEIFLTGISQNISAESWSNQNQTRVFPTTKEMQRAYTLFFKLLYDNFGITELIPGDNLNRWQQIQEAIFHRENIKLSPREVECLYYF